MNQPIFNRRGAETPRELLNQALTERIIGAAIEVHRNLGPGLLESAYEQCLSHEFALHKIPFIAQVPLPVVYKSVRLDCGCRIDLLVDDLVIVELKCIDKVLPVHEAQLLTYMRLAQKEVGLIFNFHTAVLARGGIIRKAHSKPASLSASASRRS